MKVYKMNVIYREKWRLFPVFNSLKIDIVTEHKYTGHKDGILFISESLSAKFKI